VTLLSLLQVVSASAASLCVTIGGGRPAGLPPHTPVVVDDFLLQAAEEYQLPSVQSFCIDQGAARTKQPTKVAPL
jgi:hypothetical protein